MDGTNGSNIPKGVAFSREKPRQFRLAKIKARLKKLPKIFKLATILVGAVIIVSGVFLYKHNNPQGECNGKPESPIYTEAARSLYPQAVPVLSKAVDKIKTYRNAQTDPSCLYIVTSYYVWSGDTKNARLYYDKLVTAYAHKKKYVATLGKNPQGLDYFKFNIETLENRQKIFEENFRNFN